MKAFLALIQREYLEHKGPFLYAPLLLVSLMAAAVVMMAVSGHRRFEFEGEVTSLLKFFEIGFGAVSGAWWWYMLIALFFYFSNSFSADRRNNSMLFWKSMPQTDLKILFSKFAAGLALFPTIVFVALLASGLLVTVVTLLAGNSGLGALAPPALIASYGQIALSALVFFILGLLWYAPFFAWVGSLSTIFGRWSIPLAFLVPAVLVALENLLLPGPLGGYLLSYLRARGEFGIDNATVWGLLINPQPFHALNFLTVLVQRIDWVQMIAGWAFAVIAIYAASEYRRRVLAA